MKRFALVFVCLLAACAPRERIVVGAKNFTEQRLLGELLAQTIEAAGIAVERRLDLGGTFVCDHALRAGEIDLYVEYTGTALTAILKEPPLTDPTAARRRVEAEYASADLMWAAPLGFDNTFALVMRHDDAERAGIETISQAALHAAQWRAGFGYEFKERADGYAGLAQSYGFRPREIRTMDLGLLYRALVDHEVDVAVGSATDGMIEALHLAVLRDDRHYFPPYEAAPVVRRATLERFPALNDMLAGLGGTIPATTMRRLNYAVDGKHQDPATVVRDFRAGRY